MPELETTRLRLRPFTPADADDLARIYSNPNVTRYLPRGPYAPEQGREIGARVVGRFISHWEEHDFGVWAVIDKSTERFIGQCGLNTLPDGIEIELLYLLDEPYWNQGLAGEAAIASVRYGFDVVRLNRIVAVALPQNTASRRVMEKAGLLYEKDAHYFDNDVVYYALDRKDYRSVSRLIDVSHTVEDGLVTYPGLPAPLVCDYLSREASRAHYAEGTTFQIARIEMVANTGTYVDAPFHRFADGADLAALDLARLADLEGLVVDATAQPGRAIGASLFAGLDLRDRAVLVRTGWDRHWATPRYLAEHPFLTEEAALLLRDAGARLVGIDSLNIDDTGDGRRPVHTVLLGAGIPIAEHLCALDRLPDRGFRFHAVPVKFRGVGTFPVRAYGVIDTR